jgi:hypothetical protein
MMRHWSPGTRTAAGGPVTAISSGAVRRLWQVLEPIHAVVYFAPEVLERYRDIGLKGFWMGYFAGRSHPLGAPSAELVTATFFNFHPAMVHRAIPDAWQYADPAEVATARLDGVAAALARMLGGADVDATAALAREAVEGCSVAGRPLFAAHAALAWPDPPALRLWHAATMLREHRGDGHIVANLAHGVSGLGSHVLFAATGAVDRPTLQDNRGWSDDEWSAAEAELTDRGWLRDACLTDDGRLARAAVENLTDQLAAEPVGHLGPDRAERLAGLAAPLARRIVQAGGIPVPNPMGVPPTPS